MMQSIIFSIGEEVIEWQWQVFWKIHPVPILEQGQRNTQLALVWKTSGKIRTPGGGHLDRGYNEQLRHRWGPWGMHGACNEWAWTNQWNTEKSCVGAASGQWELAVVCGLTEVEHYLMLRILEKQPEFPLAIIPFPLTPRVCALSSSPLIHTSRSSRIKIYSHIFIYTCSSCSYNTTQTLLTLVASMKYITIQFGMLTYFYLFLWILIPELYTQWLFLVWHQ